MLSAFIALVIGIAAGAVCVYVLFYAHYLYLRNETAETARRNESKNELDRSLLEKTRRRLDEESQRISTQSETLRKNQTEYEMRRNSFQTEFTEFNARKVTYDELQKENLILKQDLKNLDLSLRKLQLDRQKLDANQQQLDERAVELAQRYLKENVRWISSSVTQNNYLVCKQRLIDVIRRCREIGFPVSASEETELLSNLQAEFERAVRMALEREEQARIKARIREEQKVEREREREIQQAEQERQRIQDALDRALRVAQDQHSVEIEQLRAQLAVAEAKSQRAISMAQITKAGYVYVISNIGSFGQNVFKVGMTRRLEPVDRVRELSGASVPFPFDVHMMISCDDAPTLENVLHRELHLHRVNRMRPRKEFFRIDLDTIKRIVEDNHGAVDYVADAEALEYNQSLNMTDIDQEFIDQVYENIQADEDEYGDEVDEEIE